MHADPCSADLFLKSWGLECRNAYTSLKDLGSEVPLAEHLTIDTPTEVEVPAVAPFGKAAPGLLARICSGKQLDRTESQ
jgi:hypothetical protein